MPMMFLLVGGLRLSVTRTTLQKHNLHKATTSVKPVCCPNNKNSIATFYYSALSYKWHRA